MEHEDGRHRFKTWLLRHKIEMEKEDSTTRAYNQYPVYTGYWVNWSRGPVLGATYTTTREKGNLLIAFTALFVAYIAPRLWRIVCILFHRCYATGRRSDGLHYQRQVVLRNSSSAENSVWVLGQLLWFWSGSGQRPFRRLLPVLATASTCACAFALASGFSSEISTSVGNEVLMDGTGCRLPGQESRPPDINALWVRDRSTRMSNAANYAQQCYGNDNENDNDNEKTRPASASKGTMFDCTTFALKRLPAVINPDAPCPFNTLKNGSNICHTSSNLELDTGYLDSHEHLGINSPNDERILFRQVTNCAPLRTAGYSRNYTGPRGLNYTGYYYGPRGRGLGQNRTFIPDLPTFATYRIDFQYQPLHEITTPEFGIDATLTDQPITMLVMYKSSWSSRLGTVPSLLTLYSLKHSRERQGEIPNVQFFSLHPRSRALTAGRRGKPGLLGGKRNRVPTANQRFMDEGNSSTS